MSQCLHPLASLRDIGQVILSTMRRYVLPWGARCILG